MKINPRIYHIALLLYCLIIFIESSIPGDNFPKVNFEFSDKIIHFIIYAILYVLFFYSLKNQSKYVNLQKNVFEYSVLFTALYGFTDEVHQYFVPNRSCEFYDWVADLSGAIVMYIILKFFYQRKKNIIALLLLLGICGCSGTDNSNEGKKPKIVLAETECWLDLMPTMDTSKNILGFVLKLNFTGRSLDTNYDISNFSVNLNTGVLKNKKFGKQIESVTDSGFVMNIIQSYNEKYIERSKTLPEEAEFSFIINRNSKPVKTINTPKVKILKTQ